MRPPHHLLLFFLLFLPFILTPSAAAARSFSHPDDLDVVGYLRSLCYLRFLRRLPWRPEAVVVQTPRHSRRGVESAVPVAYGLRIPILVCCRKFDVRGLVRFLEGREEETVLVLWWGRVMPAIARALGVPRGEVPRWPNHWNGSSVLWVIGVPDRGEGWQNTPSTLEQVHMEGCDPEGERERYCLRSVWLPGLPRPDLVRHVPDEPPPDGVVGQR
ncbi:hypothetical protein DFJ74DRAFT_718642 [Hyaloraphidium curvatum]|nr:hypothetical protein DFJ74DRAFT_718642 [Hyaloraphidium curvatum]